MNTLFWKRKKATKNTENTDRRPIAERPIQVAFSVLSVFSVAK